jgi:hypothetical protein
MESLTKTQIQILNATTDDYEDLERIYRSICLEFSADRYDPSNRNAFYWRESKDRVPLSELVENLRSMVAHGLLTIKLPDPSEPLDTASDLSYLWRGWFCITPKGRSSLESACRKRIES